MPRPGVEAGDVGGILTNADLGTMKTMLKKAWREDFYEFVQSLAGALGAAASPISSLL